MFEPDMRVGASFAGDHDDRRRFLPRGEAVTSFLILFVDTKRSDLVLGRTRT